MCLYCVVCLDWLCGLAEGSIILPELDMCTHTHTQYATYMLECIYEMSFVYAQEKDTEYEHNVCVS